ncbi:TRAP dicarboxylate transporter, DctM subunit, unknown substrate 3 [Leucobacter sp. 7(1)]|uniref:TRAP transporter large permease n=1 Tax=Leucobacter sp. 7(1) TaxID=1255613 RepID=UPI00097ECB30|nr:TRAP transporter large permease [Leucobacter sp. 7(1)]SJN08117.1 TRAP dicarboxylate transporter, DctM subunit, unknown substrate 3 [Leucobacter sp. 7(1)]
MSAQLIALAGILLFFVLISLRMPIAYAMAGVGLLGMIVLSGTESAMQLIAGDVFRQFSTLSMAVIPLFIFMGQIVFHTGMSTKLFHAAYTWFGAIPGGLAATTLVSSALFSAVSGSNSAGTATIGAIVLPEMKKYGYHKRFASGTVAIGGTLGILIPPSTALIIVSVQAEQSIAALFRAALLPGFLITALLVITALLRVRITPGLAPRGPGASWGERFRSLSGTVEIVVLFGVSVVGMLLGWFSPTEAAGVGAGGAVLIGVVTRQLTWEKFRRATLETLRITAFVVMLIVSAVIFGRFLTITRLPFDLASWAADIPVAPIVVLLLVLGIYLLGGALMDGLGFLVLSIPLFYPLLAALGYDLVWATIIVVLVTTFGAVTPPVGVNAFIVAGISRDVSIIDVFRGVLPYYIPYAVVIAAFIAWPGLITFAA